MSLQVHTSRQRAEAKILKWLNAEHARNRIAQANVKENVGPYITISREAGAGGSEIARKAAKKLGWDLLDREIVNALAEQTGTTPYLVGMVDERCIRPLEDMFTSWFTHRKPSPTAYFRLLQQLLLVAAHHGNVVIVGRGARFILPPESGLSVRILAPLDFRIEQLVIQKGIVAEEARMMVKQRDKQREEFVREHFHHSASDPHEYDLVINVEKLTQSDAADLIVDAVQAWMKKKGVKAIA